MYAVLSNYRTESLSLALRMFRSMILCMIFSSNISVKQVDHIYVW